MAAAPSNEDDTRMSVMLTSEDGSRARAFVRSSACTVESVRTSWAEACEVDADRVLVLHRGRVLADSVTLGDLEPTASGLVELAVEKKVHILVGRPGAAESTRRRLLVGLSQTPEDLCADVRRALGTKDGSEVHLRTAVQELQPGRSLRDSGVLPGSLLIPRQDSTSFTAVRVEMMAPDHQDGEGWTVYVRDRVITWSSVCTQLEGVLPYNFDKRNTVAVQIGCLYYHGLEVRRAVQTWDPETDKHCLRGEVDGRLVDDKSATHNVHSILRNESLIRSCPGHLPLVSVLLNCNVLHMMSGWRHPKLTETRLRSLLDLQYLVLMAGLEMRNPSTGHLEAFIQLASGDFCDANTGQLFPDNESVVRAMQEATKDRLEWRHLFVLLGDGDAIPRWSIPEGRSVYAYGRHGVDMEVEENCLVCPGGTMLSKDEEWTQSKLVSHLQNILTSVMDCKPSGHVDAKIKI